MKTGVLISVLICCCAAAPVAANGGDNQLQLSINHVAIGVASIAHERKFYHDVLGFQIGALRVSPTHRNQQMQIPGFRIDLIEQKGSVRPTPSMGNDKQGWLHIAMTVPSLMPVYRKFKAEGIATRVGRMDGEQVGSFYVTDPEGNDIEIGQQ